MEVSDRARKWRHHLTFGPFTCCQFSHLTFGPFSPQFFSPISHLTFGPLSPHLWTIITYNFSHLYRPLSYIYTARFHTSIPPAFTHFTAFSPVSHMFTAFLSSRPFKSILLIILLINNYTTTLKNKYTTLKNNYSTNNTTHKIYYW